MKQTLYNLAIGHLAGPSAEIFTVERAALERRLELSEVSNSQRERLLRLFEAGDRPEYEKALNRLESAVDLVCAIEKHPVAAT